MVKYTYHGKIHLLSSTGKCSCFQDFLNTITNTTKQKGLPLMKFFIDFGGLLSITAKKHQQILLLSVQYALNTLAKNNQITQHLHFARSIF